MTAEMIADLLRSKEDSQSNDIQMSDYLYNFIILKYSTITLQMEFSYNLVDGLDRFKTLPHINMFRDVLYKNLSEATLNRALSNIFRIQSHLVTTLEKINAMKSSGPKQDWLSDKQFKLGESFFYCSNIIFFIL